MYIYDTSPRADKAKKNVALRSAWLTQLINLNEVTSFYFSTYAFYFLLKARYIHIQSIFM